MAYHRNHTLEMLKLFAAYMVVFLHVPFYGNFGVAVNALARFAVPFFFLVSGFFSYGITKEKIRRRIAHLAFLLAFALLICTASNLMLGFLNQGFAGVLQFFRQYLDIEKIINFLLFNKTIQVEYLWYLFAILYVYALFYFTAALGLKDRVYWAAALSGLCLQLVLGELLSAFGLVLPNHYLRNFALMGMPFFILGMMANRYRHQLARVPDAAVIALIAAGALETLYSRFTVGNNELYAGSVCILFALVVVFIKHPGEKSPAWLNTLTGCNTYIYILHPIISGIIVNLLALLGVHSGVKGYQLLRMLHPLVVCAVSTLLACGLNRILPRLESKLKHGGAA